MVAIEFPFSYNGFNHELVEREGLVCLVKRSKAGRWHYEVVKLQLRSESEFGGKHYPAHEKYPSSEQWGTYGFTYLSTDLKGAKERYLFLKMAALSVGEGKERPGT